MPDHRRFIAHPHHIDKTAEEHGDAVDVHFQIGVFGQLSFGAGIDQGVAQFGALGGDHFADFFLIALFPGHSGPDSIKHPEHGRAVKADALLVAAHQEPFADPA